MTYIENYGSKIFRDNFKDYKKLREKDRPYTVCINKINDSLYLITERYYVVNMKSLILKRYYRRTKWGVYSSPKQK